MPRREALASMLRDDLAAARESWIGEAGDDADERCRRLQSDFLAAKNHDGQVLDFHALRHTCGAWAAQGGASPKAIQTLMRHSSITLTLDTYGHMLPDEAAGTVLRMPLDDVPALRLTGTAHGPIMGPTGDGSTAGKRGAGSCDRSPRPATRQNEERPPRAVEGDSKRGGRDSNPQPPDRQSGGVCLSARRNSRLRESTRGRRQLRRQRRRPRPGTASQTRTSIG
jgi:hypothetical protein